jgi:hypothetical protein
MTSVKDVGHAAPWSSCLAGVAAHAGVRLLNAALEWPLCHNRPFADRRLWNIRQDRHSFATLEEPFEILNTARAWIRR